MTQDSAHGRETLAKVYAPKELSEQMEGYDEWALNYDKDMWSYGYSSPGVTAALLERNGGRALEPLLDLGCGTGLNGIYLKILGYENLDGLDLSEGMLTGAGSKDAYKNLHKMKVGPKIDLETDAYGAVIAIGIFTVGHVGPEGYNELFRIVRPGGLIIHSNRTDKEPEASAFRAHHEKAEAEGRWTLVEKTPPFAATPYGDPDVRQTIYVHRLA
ncbi:MAG: class I SAM-dependent DNA methyltransferase [Rhodospirillales bacterium]